MSYLDLEMVDVVWNFVRIGGYDPVEEFAKEGKVNLEKITEKIKMNFVTQLLFHANWE